MPKSDSCGGVFTGTSLCVRAANHTNVTDMTTQWFFSTINCAAGLIIHLIKVFLLLVSLLVWRQHKTRQEVVE